MNLPHLNQATQMYTGMENMKPKKPFIIPVTWNPEFCTWSTNPQNNNSPSLLPLVKGTLNKPGLSFSLGVFLHRRGAYKVFPRIKQEEGVDRL